MPRPGMTRPGEGWEVLIKVSERLGRDVLIHRSVYYRYRKVPVRGSHDWLISAQVRVGMRVGRNSRILGVPRVP